MAETSITIPGIKYVVDGGRVKQREYDPQTGAQQYRVVWCSKASAAQRAGRAGRTGPGHCYRLYSAAVFDQQFPDHSQPEIQRVPIEALVLQLKAMGIDQPRNFPLPSRPELAAVDQAERLLSQLQAILPSDSRVTRLGTLMAAVPLAPRWSRLLVLACQDRLDGVIDASCLVQALALVAVIAVGDPFLEAWSEDHHHQKSRAPQSKFITKPASSDLLVWLQAFLSFSALPLSERRAFATENQLMLKRLEESSMQIKQIRNVLGQLFPQLSSDKSDLPNSISRPAKEYLCKSIAQCLPDRIAERTKAPGVKSVLPVYRLLRPSSTQEEQEEQEQEVVFLHSSSCLVKCPPRFLVFTESIRPSDRPITLLKNATAVDEAWLPSDLPLQ